MRPHHLIAALLAAAVLLPTGEAHADQERSARARFEGRTINLADGWGEARACADDGESIVCFRSEAQMNDYLASRQTMSSEARDASALAACSTSLRLYDGTNYGSPVLSLASRGVWINLSSYGFDNRTSSYRVGACSAHLAENASGGGSWYPGSTAAGSSSSSMASGWDNRISSAYLT